MQNCSLLTEASMSELESSVLLALQALAIEHRLLEPDIWHSIAREAIAGSAPAQCIVAIALEGLGDMKQAREWFELSAAQGYAPALAKLASYSAALSHGVPLHASSAAQ
jgi:TPR repeat protein